MITLALGWFIATGGLLSACSAQVQMAGFYGPPASGTPRGIPSAAPVAPASEVSTRNFIIRAPNPQLAQQAARLAEQYRRELSIEWLGYEIAPWSEKVPVQVIIDRYPGGETSFAFVRGDGGEKAEPIGWQMKVFGPPDRVLDAVLPHEITHTIFATHFGRPLPRWADEGACTTVEHQHRMLIEFLTTGRGIAFPQMFAMKEYPADVLPLYSQGYSLARYLIERGGRHKYVSFVADGLAGDNWSQALEKHYGVSTVAQMQHVWLDWVKQGCPAPPASLAAAAPPPAAAWAATTRGQSPEGQPGVSAGQAGAPVATSAARTSIYAQARLAGQAGPVAR